MHLADGPDGSTVVQWTADVTVAGQLASLASRLMVPVSQKLASQFYEQVRKKIETETCKRFIHRLSSHHSHQTRNDK